MEEELKKYLDSLIDECLMAVPTLDRNQVSDYFNQVILETLVYSLSDEQIKEIENIDFNNPEDVQELQLLAASIPGFIFIVEDVLKKEIEEIKRIGKIPVDE